MGHILRVVGVEGAKNRSFGGMGRLGMVYAIDQKRKAKDIREKYELLEETRSASKWDV